MPGNIKSSQVKSTGQASLRSEAGRWSKTRSHEDERSCARAVRAEHRTVSEILSSDSGRVHHTHLLFFHTPNTSSEATTPFALLQSEARTARTPAYEHVGPIAEACLSSDQTVSMHTFAGEARG